MALEATIRFNAQVSEMEAKLVKVQQILQRGSFQDIDEYLRPKKAEFSLITEVREQFGVWDRKGELHSRKIFV